MSARLMGMEERQMKYIPNSFQIANAVVDDFLCRMSGNAWKCYAVIVRKTTGWQKEIDYISVSQFKNLTGIKTDVTVADALKELVELNLIASVKRHGQVTGYRINMPEPSPENGGTPPPENGGTPPPENGGTATPENGCTATPKNWVHHPQKMGVLPPPKIGYTQKMGLPPKIGGYYPRKMGVLPPPKIGGLQNTLQNPLIQNTLLAHPQRRTRPFLPNLPKAENAPRRRRRKKPAGTLPSLRCLPTTASRGRWRRTSCKSARRNGSR